MIFMATPKQEIPKMISRKKMSRARRKRIMEKHQLAMERRRLIESNEQLKKVKEELSVIDLMNLGEQKNKLELSSLLLELKQGENQ